MPGGTQELELPEAHPHTRASLRHSWDPALSLPLLALACVYLACRLSIHLPMYMPNVGTLRHVEPSLYSKTSKVTVKHS